MIAGFPNLRIAEFKFVNPTILQFANQSHEANH